MGFGKKNFFILYLDDVKHRFGADHPFFKDLDRLFAYSFMQPVLDKPAHEPIGSEEEEDESGEGKEHFDKGSPDVSWREGSSSLSYWACQSDEVALIIWNKNSV